MVSKEEIMEIKNKFKVNHAARMVNLKRAIKSPEKPESSRETKNTKTLRKLNDLLASL